MYKITYRNQYGALLSQVRNTLEEAVAYSIILHARPELNVIVVSIELIENV